MRQLLSDWQIAPLVHIASGQPLTPTTYKDNLLTGLTTNVPCRCCAITDPRPELAPAPCYQWIDPAAFISNPPGTYGNVGRGALRGPGKH